MVVAQQKMKDSSSSDGSENGRTSPSSLKSRLAMLKRSSAKKAAAASDPFRFQGNGIDYKGKLIGVRDVNDARGDEMCAEAMRSAKALIKSTGTHKQRIVLNISIQGLKIKDEKTQLVIHDFPVSRISFIARDTSDARAFGFVYGAQNGLYKFYGIKTAQTADHAVLSIRDMFQIVFEMKKKQIEEVKQKQSEESEDKKVEQNGTRIEGGVAVADLLDLETELHMIEQGVNQLQNIPVLAEDSWPSSTNAPFVAGQFNTDPFGDSFNTTLSTTGTDTSSVNWGNTTLATAPQQPAAWPAFPPAFPSAAPPSSIPGFSPSNPFVQCPPVLPPSNFSINFDSVGNNDHKWTEPRKVSTLEEAFTKLVDMDCLVPSAPAETKKNPFEHLINPPKASLNSLSTPPMIPSRASVGPPLVFAGNKADPFNDDFFN